MITLHEAIFALNPTVVTIRGDVAYDADENEVPYDKAAVEVKLAEMQVEEAAKTQAAIDAKQSAMAKLKKLGLTADEITALIGN